ncbi:hypothetical protein [Bradyrhizobium elkanii]|uniref:hypothetical protein n=1 Tax=Bradyrhizobium elkanii TaxID=29448 RepID=UPI001BAD3755|nr:hypothetical protein [Bradyrhizobium elkanii]
MELLKVHRLNISSNGLSYDTTAEQRSSTERRYQNEACNVATFSARAPVYGDFNEFLQECCIELALVYLLGSPVLPLNSHGSYARLSRVSSRKLRGRHVEAPSLSSSGRTDEVDRFLEANCQASGARNGLPRTSRTPSLRELPRRLLPAPARKIAFQNKAVVYGILFCYAAETLTTMAADRNHLGAQLDVTAVLHTGTTPCNTIRICTASVPRWTFATPHARSLAGPVLPAGAHSFPGHFRRLFVQDLQAAFG